MKTHPYDQLLASIQAQGKAVYDNAGITVRLLDLPSYRQYAKLRDELAYMSWFRRWLSWRLRKQLDRYRNRVHLEMFAAVLEGERND
jgi:hypothetical protein